MERYIGRLLEIAHENGIQVKWFDLHSRTPSASNPQLKTIVMNSNWYDKRQLPFILAHEICHILHNDNDFAILYFGSDLKRSFEYEAHKGAINLLLPIYISNFDDPTSLNYINFIETFGIPYKLSDTVKNCMYQALNR